MSTERRRAPRVEILRQVEGRVDPREEVVFVRQISQTGMLIETTASLDPAAVHGFRLYLEGGREAMVSGRIVHGRFAVVSDEVRYTLGIRFVPPDHETEELLGEFVAALQRAALPFA